MQLDAGTDGSSNSSSRVDSGESANAAVGSSADPEYLAYLALRAQFVAEADTDLGAGEDDDSGAPVTVSSSAAGPFGDEGGAEDADSTEYREYLALKAIEQELEGGTTLARAGSPAAAGTAAEAGPGGRSWPVVQCAPASVAGPDSTESEDDADISTGAGGILWPEAVAASLIPPLLSQCALVNAAAVDVFLRPLRLRSHLALLRRTFLLGDSRFVDALLPPLVATLWPAAAGARRPRARGPLVYADGAAATRVHYGSSGAGTAGTAACAAIMAAQADAGGGAGAPWSAQALAGLLVTALREAAAPAAAAAASVASAAADAFSAGARADAASEEARTAATLLEPFLEFGRLLTLTAASTSNNNNTGDSNGGGSGPLGWLQLGYSAPWPVSLVITECSLKHGYQPAFSHLAQLRAAAAAVARTGAAAAGATLAAEARLTLARRALFRTGAGSGAAAAAAAGTAVGGVVGSRPHWRSRLQPRSADTGDADDDAAGVGKGAASLPPTLAAAAGTGAAGHAQDPFTAAADGYDVYGAPLRGGGRLRGRRQRRWARATALERGSDEDDESSDALTEDDEKDEEDSGTEASETLSEDDNDEDDDGDGGRSALRSPFRGLHAATMCTGAAVGADAFVPECYLLWLAPRVSKWLHAVRAEHAHAVQTLTQHAAAALAAAGSALDAALPAADSLPALQHAHARFAAALRAASLRAGASQQLRARVSALVACVTRFAACAGALRAALASALAARVTVRALPPRRHAYAVMRGAPELMQLPAELLPHLAEADALAALVRQADAALLVDSARAATAAASALLRSFGSNLGSRFARASLVAHAASARVRPLPTVTNEADVGRAYEEGSGDARALAGLRAAIFGVRAGGRGAVARAAAAELGAPSPLARAVRVELQLAFGLDARAVEQHRRELASSAAAPAYVRVVRVTAVSEARFARLKRLVRDAAREAAAARAEVGEIVRLAADAAAGAAPVGPGADNAGATPESGTGSESASESTGGQWAEMEALGALAAALDSGGFYVRAAEARDAAVAARQAERATAARQAELLAQWRAAGAP
jgi:hypothetical protein